MDKDKDKEFAGVNEPTMLQDPMVLVVVLLLEILDVANMAPIAVVAVAALAAMHLGVHGVLVADVDADVDVDVEVDAYAEIDGEQGVVVEVAELE